MKIRIEAKREQWREFLSLLKKMGTIPIDFKDNMIIVNYNAVGDLVYQKIKYKATAFDKYEVKKRNIAWINIDKVIKNTSGYTGIIIIEINDKEIVVKQKGKQGKITRKYQLNLLTKREIDIKSMKFDKEGKPDLEDTTYNVELKIELPKTLLSSEIELHIDKETKDVTLVTEEIGSRSEDIIGKCNFEADDDLKDDWSSRYHKNHLTTLNNIGKQGKTKVMIDGNNSDMPLIFLTIGASFISNSLIMAFEGSSSGKISEDLEEERALSGANEELDETWLEDESMIDDIVDE